MVNNREYTYIIEEPGSRLDVYVAQNCPELSRSQAQKLISGGDIRVNGEQVKAGLKLETGDRITVSITPVVAGDLLPEDIPLKILYEDDDVLVIDKPPGLTVHPAPGHPNHTLVNALLSHLPNLPESDDTLRPGIVHRLDKDTSGIILVAKNTVAQANLSEQFKSHSITKKYIALVNGHLTPEQGVIEAPIGRDTRNRKKMAIAGETRGREARTLYRVMKYINKYTLLEVTTETGRTHQIRVHFSAIGYPVAGDETYGTKSKILPRQFLHATKVGFYLPSTGEYREIESPLPGDLEEALEKIV